MMNQSTNYMHCNITITWITHDSSFTDIEYVVTLSNSSFSDTFNVNATMVNVTLSVRSLYYITIISERCGGNLSSTASNTLQVSCPGVFYIIPIGSFCENISLLITDRPTPIAKPSTENEISPGGGE